MVSIQSYICALGDLIMERIQNLAAYHEIASVVKFGDKCMLIPYIPSGTDFADFLYTYLINEGSEPEMFTPADKCVHFKSVVEDDDDDKTKSIFNVSMEIEDLTMILLKMDTNKILPLKVINDKYVTCTIC